MARQNKNQNSLSVAFTEASFSAKPQEQKPKSTKKQEIPTSFSYRVKVGKSEIATTTINLEDLTSVGFWEKDLKDYEYNGKPVKGKGFTKYIHYRVKNGNPVKKAIRSDITFNEDLEKCLETIKLWIENGLFELLENPTKETPEAIYFKTRK